MVICYHRKDTESFNRAPEIQITATIIGSSGFLSKFKEWFVPLYYRGNSEKKLLGYCWKDSRVPVKPIQGSSSKY